MPEWQRILIAQIIDTLKRNYILYDKINERFKDPTLKDALTAAFALKFSGKEYDAMPDDNNGKQFALDVSNILKQLIGDQHLTLQYDPQLLKDHEAILKTDFKFPSNLPASDPRSHMGPEEIKKRSAEYAAKACGFYTFETSLAEKRKTLTLHGYPEESIAQRLSEQEKSTSVTMPENIGYFGMFFVADPLTFEVVREKLFDTMQSLQDKDAIILDLRSNSGGSPEGVRLLLSYFFKQPTHINTIVERRDGVDIPVKFITYPHDAAELIPNSKRGQQVPDLSAKPIYVLIGNNTFSAGEEIANDLKELERAILIGQPTRGAANPQMSRPLFTEPQHDGKAPEINSIFLMNTPYGRAENPISHDNWEGKGVKPDIPVEQHASPLQTAVRLAQDDLKHAHHAGMLPALSSQIAHNAPLKELPKEEPINAEISKPADSPEPRSKL